MSLFDDNTKLVYYIISKRYPTFIHDEDMIQCGMIGLWKAVKSWDENKNKFSTYAWVCITNEIKQELRRRFRQPPTVSFDVAVGENLTLEDVLIGDSDIDYLDTESYYKNLTVREKTVLNYLKEGLTEREIAEALGISHTTVNSTKRSIRKKMGEMK